MANYTLGTLSSSIASQNGFTVTSGDSTDVFSFSIQNDRNINLYLHNISASDDADLRLYADSNNNGIFDVADTLVDSSSNYNNDNEVIDYAATAGNYFVEVSRWAPGSTGWVDYDLDLSATYNEGLLGTSISRDGYTVSQIDPTDVFEFTITDARDINLYLHNISFGDDADLHLYQDSNNNGIFDADDTIVTSSVNSGNSNDLISYSATAGTYFAQVSRWAAGSTDEVSYDIDLSSSYDVGYVGIAPVSLYGEVPSTEPTDVFEFNIAGDRNINISLHNISAEDDVDVRLFSDVNSNGIFDADDQQYGALIGSFDISNNDEAINFRAEEGTYFAQVERFSGTGYGQYDLDISATLTGSASNLLPEEIQVGDLYDDQTFFGNISDSNTSDIYSFSLDFFEGVNISLTGLSSDADIRLIQDYNGNRQVDSDEVIGSSTASGNLSELISNIDISGNYYLQVYQYSGNTGYTVNFNHYATSYV
ncbi:PPC domain-containing protein [Leptolyngbya sp. FACHB-16]|uniref:PPC domain-containing protein n=1 Tax=unclassified Leptolyngbya TaxID=2650499 RepID=UPI00168A2CDB|nr:PPC domain-containing protein [Leptolyngbya sp. FACHB-16]MBD2158553.1 PPC domain-containing protein [Leptolyngbya sp. FACHB-16]